ncbi:hypothetical protein AB0K16_22015 [Nonomuraea jabiensis]|uniref:hypothetical protein n=1 Tax=Nonomuraea jabiensis TaxID=882448 RepID=UPI00343295BD
MAEDWLKAEKSLQEVAEEALSFLVENQGVLRDALEKRAQRYEENAAKVTTDISYKQLVLKWAADVREIGEKLDSLSWSQFTAMREQIMKEKD